MSILNRTFINRETFDPTNEAHLESLQHFIRTGNWGSVQFFAELPYCEVPMAVLMKFAEHKLQVSRETPQERAGRFATMDLATPAVSEDRATKLARFEAAHELVRAEANRAVVLARERRQAA